MSLQARIPEKGYLSTLPAPKFIGALEQLEAQPILFFAKVAEAIDTENNAGKNWPRLREKFDDPTDELQSNAAAFKTSTTYWHSQGLHSLPSIKKFKSPFKQTAKDAVDRVNDLLPSFERAYQAKMDLASELDLKNAQSYSTAISMYNNLLSALVKDVEATVDDLLLDYPAIQDKISAFEKTAQNLHIRVSLLKRIKTPNADNSDHAIVYVMESDSAVAP